MMMLRSSLYFIVPVLDTSTLFAKNEGKKAADYPNNAENSTADVFGNQTLTQVNLHRLHMDVLLDQQVGVRLTGEG